MRRIVSLIHPLFFADCPLPLALCLLPFLALAQPAATPADARLQAAVQRKDLTQNSLLTALKPQSIGPSVFSCRVTDVEADPADPTRMYVAYASGGLWYSESNGTSFKPVFDQEASMTIGDIAVDWTRNMVWVGTGENNSSRSSYAGTGMYRSADGGKTWEQRGLEESHHIGRVVLHPTNPDILWVAVLGHLYSPNPERGVYKTTDGGRTWARTLFVNDTTGAIDLVTDPGNPDMLYAATWDRMRRAWDFRGAGAGSGIWKSLDGGTTWTQLNTADQRLSYRRQSGPHRPHGRPEERPDRPVRQPGQPEPQIQKRPAARRRPDQGSAAHHGPGRVSQTRRRQARRLSERQ